MGKTSRRNRNRNRNDVPSYEVLDIIPGFYSVFNAFFVQPQVLQYISTLSGAARDDLVRKYVGERAWSIAHATHHKFVTSLNEGKSEQQAFELAQELGESMVKSEPQAVELANELTESAVGSN